MCEELPLAALVLVGGYGTRLRPLTFTHSKPLVEFCNKPMCEYMLDALVQVGCVKIVLALSEMQNDLSEYVNEYQSRHPNVKIIPSIETSPLGTGGPIGLAKEHLKGHRFFMLNSDVISPYPFKELLEFHKRKGGEGTIMSWDVTDPSRFGVIVTHEEDPTLIKCFVEKPKTYVGNSINAGHYIFEPRIIDRIPENQATSIELDIFPKIASDKQLYKMELKGYWMDIGTPEAFITAIPLLTTNQSHVLIDSTATIGKNCQIGPNVVIGKDCVIEDGVWLSNCVVLPGAKVCMSSYVNNSVIGWGTIIGKWTHIDQLCLFGAKCKIRDRLILNHVTVCPYKTVDRSYYEPIIII